MELFLKIKIGPEIELSYVLIPIRKIEKYWNCNSEWKILLKNKKKFGLKSEIYFHPQSTKLKIIQ